jgi:hypothetical protein
MDFSSVSRVKYQKEGGESLPFLAYTEAMEQLATQKTIIPTAEGNKIYEAGDIIEADEEVGLIIDSVKKHSRPFPDTTAEWKAGRPVKVTIAGVTKLVSKARTGMSWGNMDSVLPEEVRKRRQKLAKDRMKQERL